MPDPRIPAVPKTIEETGLDENYLLDLALKHVYFGAGLQAIEVARRMAVDFHILNGLLEDLKRQQLVTGGGGSGALGGVWFRWSVTRAGREKVSEILMRDNYRGPAPVPFDQYRAQLAHQRIDQHELTPTMVEYAFNRLVLEPKVLRHIGPAIRSGRPIFLYGPPGNGKTSMADCIAEAMRGTVYVPRALQCESEIVVVYDEVHHQPVGGESKEHDQRWVHCKRPTVLVGGELTMDMLDLSSVPQATFTKAPFQLKANSGVLFVDDFGRQRADPRDLLNRWIVPLESRFDYLTFPSGQKVRVPFDCLVVFSTNLDPHSLADEAFLRRIRYKIRLGPPSEDMYREIFQRQCRELGISYDEVSVRYLLETHYKGAGRVLKACEPRDLLQQMVDIQRFSGDMAELSPAAIDRLAELYFGEIEPKRSETSLGSHQQDRREVGSATGVTRRPPPPENLPPLTDPEPTAEKPSSPFAPPEDPTMLPAFEPTLEVPHPRRGPRKKR